MTAGNSDTYKKLLETLWRRELTQAEAAELRAWLAAHPQAAHDIAAEEELTVALARLKDAPVSPDFTARVLAAVEGEAPRGAPIADWLVGWIARRGWLPKAALAVVVLSLCALGVHQYRAASRTRLAESVALLAKVEPLPGPDVLVDYDTIRRLGQLPPPDTELLALLK